MVWGWSSVSAPGLGPTHPDPGSQCLDPAFCHPDWAPDCPDSALRCLVQAPYYPVPAHPDQALCCPEKVPCIRIRSCVTPVPHTRIGIYTTWVCVPSLAHGAMLSSLRAPHGSRTLAARDMAINTATFPPPPYFKTLGEFCRLGDMVRLVRSGLWGSGLSTPFLKYKYSRWVLLAISESETSIGYDMLWKLR